ncbi:MAG: hypothetical protein JXB43_00345 [Dehalococcoidia bacterium]|nr:hypothetical protein [Dehalococcoidia bacterium]
MTGRKKAKASPLAFAESISATVCKPLLGLDANYALNRVFNVIPEKYMDVCCITSPTAGGTFQSYTAYWSRSCREALNSMIPRSHTTLSALGKCITE